MATKRRRTRTPVVRNPDFCARALALYKEYGTSEAVASEMGVDRSTVARAIKEGPVIPRLLRKPKKLRAKKATRRPAAHARRKSA